MSKYDKIYNYNLEESNPLVEGENLIWSAKPKKSAFIINQIIAMMPIAVLWLAIDVFFIVSLLKSNEVSNILYLVIPFFAIHLTPVWIWLGNVLSANKKWKNTKYYVTDKRIIIKNGFIAENYQTIYYKDIKNVFLRKGIIDQILKVGDIHFDISFSSIRGAQNINAAFLDVENVNEIYNKLQKVVLDIQADIEYPNALRPLENPGYETKYNKKL